MMSLVVAVALIKICPEHPRKSKILKRLRLPDFIKQDLSARLPPYLRDIQIDGYEKSLKMKVIVLGNKGIVFLNLLFGQLLIHLEITLGLFR